MSARHLGVVPAADTYLSLSLAVVRPVESISRGQFRYDEENASAKNVDDEASVEICLERGSDR